MPKVIGLTGGIASGKSTVSELLSAHGFKIVDADIASRQAVEKGTKGLERVKESFGEQAIDENGEMNRAYVGEVVFNQPEKRLELNEIVHPIVREIMEKEKAQYLSEGYHVIMDIPLLFENNLQDTVDEVWLVYTSESIQIDRLMERNNISMEEAKARVYSQISIDKKRRMADHEIDNRDTKLELKQNLENLLLEEGYIESHSEDVL
ncbi:MULTISPECIES: dephospho-CoA kinase [Staphylococcus]|uniref:Dephospho-CoA kinase n=1 Tax=Staphylococcus saprophyticus subsp. saprophyticus (strain ATCC 15305 / DSM 20229 / NCIMB 8711 / NCTC 7292 / S-41) TaxID=342451 RepID=COAE_STAS1|nr:MULTISPECIES: dephospho-CoA kinase [Staphylococcus]Q49YB9.1 RecName: Full=Dephospho-CoA kinase; AltName: Full=Dephosphocoenzyme A kinase [Staphylococcus saprophyticus subsp. saprophyticus ATCC 15305 = NCTC 7292]ASF17944.1 dephospho-CoA kinase [Staphylococcus saprophyticus]MBN6755348.1 dephospho-CoA kinase [Staphylococcus saprophyticus]MBN6765326.1 dephospho-CoA kinase [Staphylococcus saprophyticus]MBN6770132.1 dephospho-CoA kinase [Staphylococcus saprophyticus]MBN6779392.1 dephospho-CoA ki